MAQQFTARELIKLAPEELAHLPREEILRIFAALKRLAFEDELTKLPNRRAFMAELEEAWEEAQRGGAGGQKGLAVVYVDLDLFKSLNDRLGHDAGDRQLRRTAEALRQAGYTAIKSSVRTEHQGEPRLFDVVARVGGDEFAVLLRETNEEGTRTVMARIAEKFLIGNIAASIGASFCPPEIIAFPRDVLKAADALMYCAKAMQRDPHNFVRTKFAVFSPRADE